MQVKISFLVWTILFLVIGVCQASPLQDFSQGKTALDINWRPNVELRHSPVDSLPTGIEFSLTHGLGDKTAVEYRQTRYDSFYLAKNTARNEELNLLYKYNNNIQFYSGYSTTSFKVENTNIDLKKNVLQLGLIGMKPLSAKTTLYAIVGGGNNVINIEAGWSYLLRPGLELNASYRHLSVESIGPARAKAHFRGVGLGLTCKF
jgi:hypothetical protein